MCNSESGQGGICMVQLWIPRRNQRPERSGLAEVRVDAMSAASFLLYSDLDLVS